MKFVATRSFLLSVFAMLSTFVEITCDYGTENCYEMNIDASYVRENVDILCQNGADCSNSILNMSLDSNNSIICRDIGTNCSNIQVYITLESTTNMSYYYDLSIYCQSNDPNICQGFHVFCDLLDLNNNSSNCTMQYNSNNGEWKCIGICNYPSMTTTTTTNAPTTSVISITDYSNSINNSNNKGLIIGLSVSISVFVLCVIIGGVVCVRKYEMRRAIIINDNNVIPSVVENLSLGPSLRLYSNSSEYVNQKQELNNQMPIPLNQSVVPSAPPKPIIFSSLAPPPAYFIGCESSSELNNNSIHIKSTNDGIAIGEADVEIPLTMGETEGQTAEGLIVSEWTCEDVSKWLRETVFVSSEVVFEFVRQRVDGAALFELDEHSLINELNVLKFGERKAILRCLENI